LIENWWNGKVDWTAPAGVLLDAFIATLPADKTFRLGLFGSAPLQLTLDRQLLSADVDLFSEDDQDLATLVQKAQLDKNQGGLYLEPGFELSFRTSPRWRQRAVTVQRANVMLTVPHPIDILIGKLDRLDPKDIRAFERVIQLTGHPTADELKGELQNAVDLFRPAFDEDSPNRFPDNVAKLWREVFRSAINVRAEIIEPALARRRIGYGESPGANYKRELGE
jgi:hypothetical protein